MVTTTQFNKLLYDRRHNVGTYGFITYSHEVGLRLIVVNSESKNRLVPSKSIPITGKQLADMDHIQAESFIDLCFNL